ncbi:MAG: ribosome maturation factor RimP [Janthinobacterium lividum]
MTSTQPDPAALPAAPADAPLDEPRFTSEHGVAARIGHSAAPVLADLGYRLVWVKMQAGPPSMLRIMAERPDGTFTIGDCEAVSRALSPILDLDDPIAGEYRLEISSPGIDRPLVRLSDLRRAMGHEARVELSVAMDGRRRFRGLIAGVHDDGRLVLQLLDNKASDPGTVEIPVRDIGEAKLFLTDALIRVTLKAQKDAGEDEAPSDDTEAAPAPEAGRGPGRFAERNKAKRAVPAGIQTRARPAPKAPRGR